MGPLPVVESFSVSISADVFVFARSTGVTRTIPRGAGGDGLRVLAELLRQLKTEVPDRADITLRADDNVDYATVMHTMDVIIGAQFPDVTLAPREGA